MRPLLMIAMAALMPMQAARALPTDAQACVTIEDDKTRLACFDGLHGTRRGTDNKAGVPDAANPAIADNAPQPRGLLSRAWALGDPAPLFRLQPYRPIYVLPVSVTDNINRRPSSPAPGHSTGVDLPNRALEAKFQFSTKVQLLRAEPVDLWLGYTQSSRWQVYQGQISRPFRETNYEPELILNVATDFDLWGWRGRMAGLALSHQSNGRALPLSRSWNRVIGHVGFEREGWSVLVRPWLRLRESADQDDNPDIEDHVGRADVTLRHATSAGSLISLRLRHSLRGGERSRGAAEFEWSVPLSGRLHGFAQWFSGYGESLIDYNIRQTRIGLGFTLAGWQ